jgi:succinate dehydrogenase / fumarate reductase, cytochrome b subunit
MADAPSQRGARPERPLSPHIQIYKPLINMVMSIFHRITGAALYFGTLLLAWWLIAAATSPQYFNYVSSWFSTLIGQIAIVGYTWALLHHMFGGLRHFIWDTGRGYELDAVDKLSWGTIILSVLATAVIWYGVCATRGGV